MRFHARGIAVDRSFSATPVIAWCYFISQPSERLRAITLQRLCNMSTKDMTTGTSKATFTSTEPAISWPEAEGFALLPQAVRLNIIVAASMSTFIFMGTLSVKSVFYSKYDFIIQSSRKCICSSVWNQCSPPGITVNSALTRFAKAVMVSREVRLSCSPYKMRVGIDQESG